MTNSAKQIEKLVKATVVKESYKLKSFGASDASIKYFGSSDVPPVGKGAVPQRIIKVTDKIQQIHPSKLEGGKGWTAPLTQSAPFETGDPVLYTDTTGLLTFLIKPLTSCDFKTADNPAVSVRFNFTEPPRP